VNWKRRGFSDCVVKISQKRLHEASCTKRQDFRWFVRVSGRRVKTDAFKSTVWCGVLSWWSSLVVVVVVSWSLMMWSLLLVRRLLVDDLNHIS